MGMFVRLADDFGGAIPFTQKSFFRNIVAVAVAGGVFLRAYGRAAARPSPVPPGRVAIPRDRMPWWTLVWRSVFGTIGIFGNFYALSAIPIGEAMTLNKTAPFFAVVFSWMFLRERASPGQLARIAVAFIGAAFVMKPGFAGEETFATVCALAGGLGAGIAYTCVRELGILRVEGSLIVLFFSAFSTIGSIPFFVADPAPMTVAQTLVLLCAGVGAAIGQFGVTAAYRYAAPRDIAVYDYSNVVFTAIFGFLFFAQVPDLLSVVGFLLIVLAGFRR